MTYLVDQRKNTYFLIIAIVTATLISIPLLSNHFLHTSHYFHLAVHEAGFILAIFLAGMTIIAYQKTKITRMLFSAAAFVVLATGQIFYIYEKIDVHVTDEFQSVAEGHFDFAILIMTALFAIGIFYKR